jgi:ABC-type Zn uptake system ZnuABC Zn-binding protein ZnuA
VRGLGPLDRLEPYPPAVASLRRATSPRWGEVKSSKPVALCILALALALAVTPAFADDRLPVVVTTTDLRALVEAVGGDHVEVTSLVPPGFDAEDYQPKPQDAVRLKRARLAVRVGLDFDLWFDRLSAQADASLRRGGPGYVDASYAIAALEVRGLAVGPGDGHAHGNGNPHYWLDPKNADIVTGNILEGLARVDPAHGKEYEANRIAFLARLDQRLADWEHRFGALAGTPLVAYHNSWAYFARRFRLDFVGYLEPKPDIPPTPAHLAGLVDMMRARGAMIIVREPHEPSRDVNLLAQRTGATVVVLAASVGALPGADDYLSLFETDLATLLAVRK